MKVHLYSHVMFATGYGRAGRELAESLLTAGVELEIGPVGKPTGFLVADVRPGLQELFRGRGEFQTTPDVVIVHTLPVDCARVLEHLELKKGAGPKLVIYTTWEAWSKPPQFLLDSWAKFDQLWMPSNTQWHHPDIEHHSVPHSLDPTRRASKPRPEGSPFRFYYLGAWDVRKQPAALIRTFANTFTPDDDVELVFHTVGMDKSNFHTQVATTGLQQNELPKMRLSNEYLTDDQIVQFHADGDCFVTATRWEAFNLPAFDAMLARRMVIATKYMGSDDFLFDTNARLVGSQQSPCAADVRAEMVEKGLKITVNAPQGLTARALWREPCLKSIGVHMRMIFDDRINTLKLPPAHLDEFTRTTVGRNARRYLENP